jgi:hypothetical protein
LNWICPYCNLRQIVTGLKRSEASVALQIHDGCDGPIGMKTEAVGCSNPECKGVEITTHLISTTWSRHSGKFVVSEPTILMSKKFMPSGAVKPQPEFIPQGLRADYAEACLVRDLSPKASATLARRCLQGMIRDFCGISKGTLFKEIEALHTLVSDGNAPKGVSEDSVEAIDHIRKIGNIGAHMEKDINVIIDVDPEEAQVLIELIETLFDEWYVARQKRQERFDRVKAIADEKAAQKQIAKE